LENVGNQRGWSLLTSIVVKKILWKSVETEKLFWLLTFFKMSFCSVDERNSEKVVNNAKVSK